MPDLSKLKLSRPGQLLALVFAALVLGVIIFALLPAGVDGPKDPVTAIYKAWLLCGFACEGLIIDMVVFHRSRPGDAPDLFTRFLFEARRAFIMGMSMLAGGLAL